MPDMKHLNVESITLGVAAAAESLIDELRHAAGKAIEDVRSTARALADLPKSSSELLERALVAVTHDFQVRAGKAALIGFEVRTSEGTDFVPGRAASLLQGNYRALIFILPAREVAATLAGTE